MIFSMKNVNNDDDDNDDDEGDGVGRWEQAGAAFPFLPVSATWHPP